MLICSRCSSQNLSKRCCFRRRINLFFNFQGQLCSPTRRLVNVLINFISVDGAMVGRRWNTCNVFINHKTMVKLIKGIRFISLCY
jgi:hypothetical protein